MAKISELTALTSASIDGTELLVIVDGGTTFKTTVNDIKAVLCKEFTQKPVTQGTVTAVPTTVPVTAGSRNLWWINTTSASVNLSALGSIGLAVGQSAVFRKTSTDSNTVTFTVTTGGTSLTKSQTITLNKHWADDAQEIELVWDGSGYTLVSENASLRNAGDLNYKHFGTITAKPSAALTAPVRVNIFAVNTAAGDVTLSSMTAPATLGLSVGDRMVFRKGSTDVNRVVYADTLEGVATTLYLTSHYSNDLAQIDLLCISTVSAPYYLLLNH